jgi:hypothetical protein
MAKRIGLEYLTPPLVGTFFIWSYIHTRSDGETPYLVPLRMCLMGDSRANLAMIYINDFGAQGVDLSCATAPLRCVLVFLASHGRGRWV